MRTELLHRFAVATATCAFLLLLAGGMVTSTGSSLAVPDWPLAYGQYFPPMVGGILFEHGHRMIAGVVGIMTLILAAVIQVVEPRRWVRRLALAAGGGIILQALLGGLTVLYLLPPPVSILHACLGQTVFCLLVALAQLTSRSYLEQDGAGLGSLWQTGALVVAAVFFQLLLGAILRHTGQGLILHVLGAVLAVAALSRLFYRSRGLSEGRLEGPTGLLMILLPLQLILGLAAIPNRLRTIDVGRAAVPTSHVVCGAAILATSLLWTLRAHRAR